MTAAIFIRRYIAAMSLQTDSSSRGVCHSLLGERANEEELVSFPLALVANFHFTHLVTMATPTNY